MRLGKGRLVQVFVTESDPERMSAFVRGVSLTLDMRLPEATLKKLHDNLKSNIRTNKYGFKLKRGWKNYKRRKGLPLIPFVAHGYYINSIIGHAQRGFAILGIDESAKNPNSKLSVAEIATVLELGSTDGRIKPRNLWRRTTRETLMNLRTTIRETIEYDMHGTDTYRKQPNKRPSVAPAWK